jgi:hypothetical protein
MKGSTTACALRCYNAAKNDATAVGRIKIAGTQIKWHGCVHINCSSGNRKIARRNKVVANNRKIGKIAAGYNNWIF